MFLEGAADSIAVAEGNIEPAKMDAQLGFGFDRAAAALAFFEPELLADEDVVRHILALADFDPCTVAALAPGEVGHIGKGVEVPLAIHAGPATACAGLETRTVAEEEAGSRAGVERVAMEGAELCASGPAFLAAEGAPGGETPGFAVEGAEIGICHRFVLEGERDFVCDAVFAIEIETPAIGAVDVS